MIIGGRYGSLSIEDREEAKANPDIFFSRIRSITEKEYDRARARDIPIFIFVSSVVYAEYQTYKQNKENASILYAHVDDPRIFQLVDDIAYQRRNNFIKPFDNVDEILVWLRDQWSGLFSDFLKRKSEFAKLEGLKNQVEQLATVVKSIQNYSEELIKATLEKDSSRIIERERDRILLKAEEEMVRHAFIQWFVDHEYTQELFEVAIEERRSEIFNALMKASNAKSFLRSIGLSEEQVEASTTGVEHMLGRDFGIIKRQLIDMIT